MKEGKQEEIEIHNVPPTSQIKLASGLPPAAAEVRAQCAAQKADPLSFESLHILTPLLYCTSETYAL